jgi:STE24 endopeptidase
VSERNHHTSGISQTEKAALYNQAKRRHAFAQGILWVVFLLYLLEGSAHDIRRLVMTVGGGPVVWVGLYFVIFAGVFELISLPFTVASGYFVEKRYGQLNQTAKAWTWDLIKAQTMGLLLGLIAVELLYVFIRSAGIWWWLWAGGAFALFFIILAQITPILILPVFYKFRKMDDQPLTDRLMTLCRRAGEKVIGIYIWDLAVKTRKANAALIGLGATRRVILADTLLDNFTASEVEVVLAHELGHHRLHHLPVLLILNVVVALAAFFAADLAFYYAGQYLDFPDLTDVGGMPFLALVFTVVVFCTLPLVNGVSRYLEYQADWYALRLTGLVGSFISTMERLAALNLSELKTSPVMEFLFHSHPTPAKRIEAAKQFRRMQVRRSYAVH